LSFQNPCTTVSHEVCSALSPRGCLTGAFLCLADEVPKSHPDYQPEGGFNVLSFDGGGVRGISSLYILKILMERLDPINPPKPYEYFDMIAGTSTGGSVVKFPKKA
jgi:hypothetical protein